MKKKSIFLFSLLLLASILIFYSLFTSQFSAKFNDIQIVKGMVKLVQNKEAVPVKKTEAGITFCSIAKKGCEDFVNMTPKAGQELTEEQKECLSSGCLAWGLPERENYTLELTNAQASSLVNDYKPSTFLVNNIKLKFEKDKAYCQGLSLYPFAPGEITIEIIQTGLKQIQITNGYLGRIPMPDFLAKQVEKYINKYLGYEWQNSQLSSFKLEDGKIIIQAKIPKILIEEIKILDR
ncbi:hypothetical protein ISS86_01975 [Candidatus Microgenomates bacterium]|nr:hypothetical protein [Candidatus Microgenomates bacterium]